jgi:hypothetical protein
MRPAAFMVESGSALAQFPARCNRRKSVESVRRRSSCRGRGAFQLRRRGLRAGCRSRAPSNCGGVAGGCRCIGSMTPDDFRRIALSMPQSTEVYRWGHSEFRVERRTFASLGGPADRVATLNLTSEQQAMFVHAAPRVFEPVAGGGLAAPMCCSFLPKRQ